MGHAAMIGGEAPAPGGPGDLTALLYPPKSLPHKPGRVREYTLAAVDRQIEVAKGVFFSAWTYGGTVPGPVIRATEDDLLRVKFANAGSHPHTIHFHGIHPANMDGVFEVVEPGNSFTYEFPARPYGMHLYHCHSTPLKKHIAKGLYGAFIIDPPKPRKPAQELVMVLTGSTRTATAPTTLRRQRPFYCQALIGCAAPDRSGSTSRSRTSSAQPVSACGDFFRYRRVERPLRVHRHGHDVSGAARDHRDRLRPRGPVHVPRTPVGVHRARLDGILRGRRLRAALSTAAAERLRPGAWRLWALVPLLLLVGVVTLFASSGTSLLDLVGQAPPPRDEFDIRRVEFRPGEISIRVTNPQRPKLTIASVTVDDAIVPFRTEGPATLGRLRSSTIVVPFHWVEEDPYTVGVTSSSGIESTFEVPAAVETRGASPRGFLGYALIGFLVGIVPVALGLGWLPSLRRAGARWIGAFMALTAGLLSFLAFDALAEALDLQARLPSGFQGPGLILLGVSASYLGLTFVAQRFSAAAQRERSAPLEGAALATLVALGIGLHNLGEGLAIGSSIALGELALGTFLIVGFMVHNITEGLGIAAPIAGGARIGLARLGALALIAGAPAIAGAWIGGFITSDVLGVLFFALAVNRAAGRVEVGRYVARRAPGGLRSGHVIGGYLAGIIVMYGTGLLVG